jgi:hypothetical protein
LTDNIQGVQSNSHFGDVAQLGERSVRNAEVVGSIPIISTIENEQVWKHACFFVLIELQGSNPLGWNSVKKTIL